MVYFDDNIANLTSVRLETNIHTIHIADTGIRWEDIANGRIATVNMLNGSRGIVDYADVLSVTPIVEVYKVREVIRA